jgi:hypothetical protein
LKPIANTDNVRAIQTHGAKSIQLDAMLFSETVDLFNVERSGPSSRLREVLLSFVEKDLQCPDILRHSELQATLALKLRRRATSVERVSLGEVAKRVLSDDGDSYTIVLGNDDVIRASELVHSKTVQVSSKNKQIDHLKLWDRMFEYLQELEASGALEL